VRPRLLCAALVALSIVLGRVAAAAAEAPLVLEPVADLLPRLAGRIAPDVPGNCAAEDEIRPALGCLPYVRVAVDRQLRAAGQPLRRRYPWPTPLPFGAVVEPALRQTEERGWMPLPAAVVDGSASGIEVVVPAEHLPDTPFDLTLHLRPIPPPKRRHVSAPVTIGRGAVLRVGIALDPVAYAVASAAVDFRLLARTAAGERELLAARLDPTGGTARPWRDFRIDLGALAGETVRFVFVTRTRGDRGAPAHPAAGFPLWGAPHVLEPRPRGERPNVILISLDTLRADHVGAYGSTLPTTPVIDRLASAGGLVEQVMAPYPATPASHMSMLTGYYPATHGVRGPADQLAAGITTLAEIVGGRGYQTAAVTENGMLVAGAGFERGFRSYRENKGASIWETSGQVDVTFRAAARWLEDHRDERFFLFLHTYQVHDPYRPPAAFDLFKTHVVDGVERPIDRRTARSVRLQRLYAGEVRYTDSELGRLLDDVTRLGAHERLLLVITSDHGEEFHEHGWIGHDLNLYDAALRVPLMLHAPGLLPAGVRVPGPASLVDVAPTILDLLGIAAPAGLAGVSLAPALRAPPVPPPAERAVFAELDKKGLRLTAVVRGNRKWIFGHEPPRPAEVYDLATDPLERQNLATTPLVAEGEALARRYQEEGQATATRLARAAGAPAQPALPPVDPRTTEKLRALGYVP
jgi:arylsulfatase A-like enzyme